MPTSSLRTAWADQPMIAQNGGIGSSHTSRMDGKLVFKRAISTDLLVYIYPRGGISDMHIQPTTLLGKRAKLIPLEESHIDALYEAGRFPEIWSWWPVRIRTHEEMEHLVKTFLHAQQEGQAFPFTIVDRDSGQVIGGTRLHNISHANRSLEIGKTWLTPAAWGTHLNTECKYLLLRYCFETLETLRVQLKTDVRNVRSQRAIERLGAVKEGVLRHHWIMPDGHVRDSVLYSMLLEEWPACKKHLEQILHTTFSTQK